MRHWVPSPNDLKGPARRRRYNAGFQITAWAAAIQISFFAPRWPSRLTRLEPPGGIFGVVSEHDICSGAPDSGQDFQHDALLVEPPVARGRLDHRVFPADVIGRDRNRSEERRVGKECRSRWSTCQ